jgi:hypothetical protein
MNDDVLDRIKNHLYNMPFAMDKRYMKMAIEEIEQLRAENKELLSRNRYYDAPAYNAMKKTED